jgi:hypothetical protein
MGMTQDDKVRVIRDMLEWLDCNYPMDTDPVTGEPYDPNLFSYELGSNEGCYMQIGGFVYRCHSLGHEGVDAIEFYRKAVMAWLSMA